MLPLVPVRRTHRVLRGIAGRYRIPAGPAERHRRVVAAQALRKQELVQLAHGAEHHVVGSEPNDFLYRLSHPLGEYVLDQAKGAALSEAAGVIMASDFREGFCR